MSFLNERALMAIVSVLESYTEPPDLNWPQQEIDDVIYSKWVVGEILDLVWDHPWTLASETIEQFAWKLETFAATAAIEDQKRIFSIAAETAWELLEEIKEVEQ